MVSINYECLPKPDYHGGSIVNLMSSIIQAMGGTAGPYPPLRHLDSAPLQASKNVVLLVIDGLGYSYLMQQRNSVLQSLVRERITSVFPTTTATAITTYLTGLAPQQHGLTGWFTYFKELGNVIAVLPFRPRHNGPPLSQSGLSAAELFGHTPVFDLMPESSYVVVPKRIVDSDYNLAHSGSANRQGYSSLSQMFEQVQKILRNTQDRKYIYAYWPELDALAHTHGIASEQVAQHFHDIDQAFGRFVDNIKGSDATVMVTADHGIIDTQPDHAIELLAHPELARTLSQPLCGERRLAYAYVHAHKREQFESYINKHLSDHIAAFPSQDLLAQGYFGLGAAHPHLADRIGDYTLAMKANYTINDWVMGEQEHKHIGVHGGVSDEELYVPLIVMRS